MKSLKHWLLRSLALATLFFLVSSGAAQSFNFTTIDFPCCTKGIAPRTALGGINPAGDIVGVYRDDAGKSHGFLLSGGQFTTIDVPGSLVGVIGNLSTTARGIGHRERLLASSTLPSILPKARLPRWTHRSSAQKLGRQPASKGSSTAVESFQP
jgi:hypothetical protein